MAKKRFKLNVKQDKKAFAKSGFMMNSENRPRMARGGIRF